MDAFSLLTCLVFMIDFTASYPDLSHGYHYEPGYGDSEALFLHAPNSNLDSKSSSSSGSFRSFNGAVSFNQDQTTSIFGDDSNNFYSFETTSQRNPLRYSPDSSAKENYGPQQTDASFSPNSRNNQPIVTTHFYLHSSPEEEEEQSIVRYINVGRPRKNYHVVFVKAPLSSPTSKVKVIANVAPVEDKTSIYVLSKQPPAVDVSAEVVTQPPAGVENQPEVFFIKYKTPEEALQAQHMIQAQYNALDDSNEHSDDVKYFKGQKSSDTSPIAASAADSGDNSFQQTHLPTLQL